MKGNEMQAQAHETATDQDLLNHYGMKDRPIIRLVEPYLPLTNAEVWVIAELVGAEESEAWEHTPQIAARLHDLFERLLKTAGRMDAEAAA